MTQIIAVASKQASETYQVTVPHLTIAFTISREANQKLQKAHKIDQLRRACEFVVMHQDGDLAKRLVGEESKGVLHLGEDKIDYLLAAPTSELDKLLKNFKCVTQIKRPWRAQLYTDKLGRKRVLYTKQVSWFYVHKSAEVTRICEELPG